MHRLQFPARLIGIVVIIAPAVITPQVVRPSGALTIEAEALAGAAQATQGQVGVQSMRGFGSVWSGGAQLFWGGAQKGAQLRLVFTTTATGQYEVFLQFTRAPDFAIVQARLDGAPPITFDSYAPTVSRDRVSLGIRALTAGAHELRLAITEKNGKSSGFNVGLDRIELDESADRRTSGGPREEEFEARAIEPLAMSTRIEVTQKALGVTSTQLGTPGETLRLSARITNRPPSALQVRRGTLDARKERSQIVLPVGGMLDLYFEPVLPNRPHLLECGCSTQTDAQVRLEGRIGKTWAVLATLSFSKSDDRLLAVVVPAEQRIPLGLTMAKGAEFRVSYCELTPFK